MSSRKKIAAVVITTVALSVGTVGVASASQSKSTAKAVSVKQTTTKTTVNSIANPMAGGGAGKMDDRGSELTTVLAGLVTKGTITQAQSDAITAALTAAHAAHESMQGADHAGMDANRVARDAEIARVLGKTTAAIQAELATGKSLGTVAGANRGALITALVALETKEIDAAVTAGKISAAQATTLKSGLTSHVTAQVDAVRPAMGPGMGGEKRGGKGGRGGNH